MSKLSKKIGLLLTCLSLSTVCFALQEKSITNNGSATAFVSIKGLTRIAIDSDRISHVLGPDGAYELKEDDKQGAIFVHPINDYQKKPFTLFLSTENNQNYVLRLIPRNQNADTILLEPLDSINPAAQRWETASPYTEAVTHLMSDMVNHNSPEGYAVDTSFKSKKQYLGNVATLKLAQIYSGAYLQGYVYCLTNTSSETITLSEREFYQPGDRAIALSNTLIMPEGQTWLYKVRSHA